MSAYADVKAALVTLLGDRPALSNVNVSYGAPVKTEDLRTPNGRFEGVWFADADGTMDVTVFAGSPLRFDENLDLECIVQVLGRTDEDTQQAVDARCLAIATEILEEVANDATLGISGYELLYVTPARQEWETGVLEGTSSAHGARLTLTFEIVSRRSFG